MRAVLRNVDKNQPISNPLHGQPDCHDNSRAAIQARLLATFAVVALALTIVGIYGVLRNSVAQTHPRDRRAHGARRSEQGRDADAPEKSAGPYVHGNHFGRGRCVRVDSRAPQSFCLKSNLLMCPPLRRSL